VALNAARFRDNAQLQAAARNAPALQFGAEGEHVQILQRALIELGLAMPVSTSHNAVLPDGIYGQETVGAVRQFQQREGLGVDGVAGKQTMTRLDDVFIAIAAQEEISLRRRMPRFFWT
jgi:peptidoglycan hydrolase-like protein with peptidoglycan-binding domain